MLCSLVFAENPSKTYYAGSLIQGCVIISLKREKYIPELKIHIKGRARVNFRDDHYKAFGCGKEKLIDEYLLILSEIRLPAGKHCVNFEYYLPWSCPQSLKTKDGSIKYQAIIVIPKKFGSRKIPFEFFVLNYSPLSFIEDSTPIRINISSRNTVSLPKDFFILGESVPIDIDNDEMKNRQIKIYLVQYIWYHDIQKCGPGYKRKQKTNVLKVPFTTTEPMYNEYFRIPDNIPTTLEHLDIIKVRYILKIYIGLEKYKLPIVIGSHYQ